MRPSGPTHSPAVLTSISLIFVRLSATQLGVIFCAPVGVRNVSQKSEFLPDSGYVQGATIVGVSAFQVGGYGLIHTPRVSKTQVVHNQNKIFLSLALSESRVV